MSFIEERCARIECQLNVLILLVALNLVLSIANLVAVYKLDAQVAQLTERLNVTLHPKTARLSNTFL